ncbi:hypothetical protein AKJ16_DCAP16514 [Drosera capensis]
MEKYLRYIKLLADSLAAIDSSVSNADLIEHTLMGLGTEFESQIAVVLKASIVPSFEDVRSKLLLHEQRLKFLSSFAHPQHQAFAAAPRSSRGRGKFKGGRPSQPWSGSGSFSGQAPHPSKPSQEQSKGILRYHPTYVSDRSGRGFPLDASRKSIQRRPMTR